MKKSLYLWIILSLSLIGCQESEKSEQPPEKEDETHMDDEKINDMIDLFESPMSEGENTIDTVIKVVSTKGNGSPEETIAIDIQDGKIYLEPRIVANGVEAKTGSVPVNDVDDVRLILEDHHVQDWNAETTLTFEDANEPNLWLQFEDGTVERYREAGTGDNANALTDLIQELHDFVDARVIKIDPLQK